MEKVKGEHRNEVADSINLETPEGWKLFKEMVGGYLSKGYDIEIRRKKDGVAIYIVTKKKALMAAV